MRFDDVIEGAAVRDWAAQAIPGPFADWFINDATPDERHQMASCWNWSFGVTPLRWIVTRRDCDRATALLVFWRALPDDFLKDEMDPFARHGDPAAHDLIDLIRALWADGFYTRSEIAFDMETDEIYRMQEELAAAPADVIEANTPAAMQGPMAGRRLVPWPDYDNGFPKRFWPS